MRWCPGARGGRGGGGRVVGVDGGGPAGVRLLARVRRLRRGVVGGARREADGEGGSSYPLSRRAQSGACPAFRSAIARMTVSPARRMAERKGAVVKTTCTRIRTRKHTSGPALFVVVLCEVQTARLALHPAPELAEDAFVAAGEAIADDALLGLPLPTPQTLEIDIVSGECERAKQSLRVRSLWIRPSAVSDDTDGLRFLER